jgi:hypothetical protein
MDFHISISWIKLLDWGSLSVTIASLPFVALLPHLAAALAVVWWLFRIYGQWLENKKLKKELKDGD